MDWKLFFKRLLFFILMIVLLPVLIIEAIVQTVKKYKRRKIWQERELDGQRLIKLTSITDIDKMEDFMFVYYLKLLFFYDGYKVDTPKKGKNAPDLILSKDNMTIAVTAKISDRPVSSKYVQLALNSKLACGTSEAWLICQNKFTPQAKLLSDDIGVKLIDRDELVNIYSSVKENSLNDANSSQNLQEKVSFEQKYPNYI